MKRLVSHTQVNGVVYGTLFLSTVFMGQFIAGVYCRRYKTLVTSARHKVRRQRDAGVSSDLLCSPVALNISHT